MSRLHFVEAQAVFDAFPTASGDIETKPDARPPLDFLRALVKGPAPDEAIAFCAYVLPRRVAVWWASQCVRALQPGLSPADEGALRAAEDWARAPDEQKRNHALRIGDSANPKLASTWVARAAAWSGGSLLVDNEQGPSGPPHLTAVAARTAVNLALVGKPDRVAEIARCAERCAKLAED